MGEVLEYLGREDGPAETSELVWGVLVSPVDLFLRKQGIYFKKFRAGTRPAPTVCKAGGGFLVLEASGTLKISGFGGGDFDHAAEDGGLVEIVVIGQLP